ncbi:hypothetical protein [Effusibacillus lacus]|uniref:hypothetical protein n=1 Tax=Effusibacillus lacus TaxID=1348429 RepID=UPI000BB6C8D5|nr:hypothetical protein [Effusibacillus lacus]
MFTTGDAESVEVLLQVERKARGFLGVFQVSIGLDERYVRFTVTSETVTNGSFPQQLQDLIRKSMP